MSGFQCKEKTCETDGLFSQELVTEFYTFSKIYFPFYSHFVLLCPWIQKLLVLVELQQIVSSVYWEEKKAFVFLKDVYLYFMFFASTMSFSLFSLKIQCFMFSKPQTCVTAHNNYNSDLRRRVSWAVTLYSLFQQWLRVRHPSPFLTASWRVRCWSGVPVWATAVCLAMSSPSPLCSPAQEMEHGTETSLSVCVSHLFVLIW